MNQLLRLVLPQRTLAARRSREYLIYVEHFSLSSTINFEISAFIEEVEAVREMLNGVGELDVRDLRA